MKYNKINSKREPSKKIIQKVYRAIIKAIIPIELPPNNERKTE